MESIWKFCEILIFFTLVLDPRHGIEKLFMHKIHFLRGKNEKALVSAYERQFYF